MPFGWSPGPRLALVFLDLALRHGERRTTTAGDEALFVEVSLSRRELAQLINPTEETAIRLMSRWREAGWVETESDGFWIYAPEQIASISRVDSDRLSLLTPSPAREPLANS